MKKLKTLGIIVLVMLILGAIGGRDKDESEPVNARTMAAVSTAQPSLTPRVTPKPTLAATATPEPEQAPVLAIEETPATAADPGTRAPDPTADPAVQTPAPTKDPAVQTYVLNTNTLKFHYPSCSSVSDMKESNKWVYEGTREEILEMGYSPCGRCHP